MEDAALDKPKMDSSYMYWVHRRTKQVALDPVPSKLSSHNIAQVPHSTILGSAWNQAACEVRKGGEAKGGLRQGGQRSGRVDDVADDGWDNDGWDCPLKRDALWDESPAASALRMPLIHALPPTFLAEVEATLPRPCGAQMVAGTILCGCGLSSIVQERFVAETSFLVAMIAGSLVEVGARLTRKARYQRWFPLFGALFCLGSSEPLLWLVAAVAEWWQLR
ncbi:hypothetical protein L7F22_041429 [Adiantum nelumboides]|nr:hypothetical protein [Adiantum nelumboides]